MKCLAKQYSDQMVCNHCGIAWDMNDPYPPTCRRAGAHVVNLWASAPNMLRRIANMMDSGAIADTECTLVTGQEVYHCGGPPEGAGERAVFNLQFGIAKMMKAAVESGE